MLPGRGTTFYREIAGPVGAPTVVLLHGWTTTADLNFYTCYEELGKHFRIIAIDHRGHGRGIRSSQSFRLSDCADDVAALMDQLGITTFIPVGYSMGGTIAQLLWKRHDQRVRGLVLAATAGHWATSRQERFMFSLLTGIGGLARIIPSSVQQSISNRTYLSRKTMAWEPWAAEQVKGHDWRNIVEAGSALGRFDSRHWLAEVDVPTAVIVTTEDQVVSPRRQRTLARLIPNTHVFEISGNHDAVNALASEFVPLLVNACLAVHQDARIKAKQSGEI